MKSQADIAALLERTVDLVAWLAERLDKVEARVNETTRIVERLAEYEAERRKKL